VRIGFAKRLNNLLWDDSTPFRAGMTMLAALVLLVFTALVLDWLLRADNFPIANVNFEGRFENVTRDHLVAAVKGHVRGNFFAADLNSMKEHVESIPWVYRASVRRQWPRDLHIRFEEQELVSKWGKDAWLNRSGELVRLDSAHPSDVLPELRGPEGTHAHVLARYQDFSELLRPVSVRIMGITLTPRRTWRLQLDSGVTLILEREGPDAKIKRFSRVYRHALAKYETKIKQVDLRYTNGFAVEWSVPRITVVSKANMTITQ
jgi:cell division protein FtsQ